MVAIYARVSTEEQADNFSIPAQLDLLRSYCRSMGYEIYDEYVDAGHSGTTPDRPDLTRLIEDARTGKFQVILVYRIDRFFRSVKDLLFVVDHLDKLGVSFRSVTEPFDTTNPIGKFMLSLLGGIAQLERDTFIERSMMGKVKRAEEGYVVLSHPPFGWDYIIPAETVRKRRTEKGYLVVNEKEAEAVRLGFYQYIKPDQSTYSVADYLNSLGYRTKKGRKWTGERVYAMLANPAYMGEWWYKDNTMVPIPKIINRDIFEITRQLLKERKNMIHRTTHREYLLRGLLRCKHCGRYMGGTTQFYRRNIGGKRVGDPYRETFYYRCNTNTVSIKFNREERCPSKWIKGDELETQVLNYLSEILSNPEKLEQALSYQSARVKNQQADTESKIKDLGKSMDRLVSERERILEAYRSGVIEIHDLRKALDNIKERHQAVEQQISEVKLSLTMEEEKSRNIQEIIEKHRGNWKNIHGLSFEKKRDLLMKTVKIIWAETTLDDKVTLDIECILPKGGNESSYAIPPLASHEPDRFR